MSGAKIHLLCASHIRTERHVTLLVEMIHSWRAQTHAGPLHISLSYDATQTATLKSLIAAKVQGYPSSLHICSHKQQKKQGEHYKWLICDKLKLGNVTDWYCCIDDDDTIAPHRMESFQATILDYNVKIQQPLPVTHKVEHEYYEFAVTSRCAQYFFIHCPTAVLTHRMADLYFVNYMLAFGEDFEPEVDDADHTQYNRRTHTDHAHVSQYKSATPEEFAVDQLVTYLVSGSGRIVPAQLTRWLHQMNTNGELNDYECKMITYLSKQPLGQELSSALKMLDYINSL